MTSRCPERLGFQGLSYLRCERVPGHHGRCWSRGWSWHCSGTDQDRRHEPEKPAPGGGRVGPLGSSPPARGSGPPAWHAAPRYPPDRRPGCVMSLTPGRALLKDDARGARGTAALPAAARRLSLRGAVEPLTGDLQRRAPPPCRTGPFPCVAVLLPVRHCPRRPEPVKTAYGVPSGSATPPLDRTSRDSRSSHLSGAGSGAANPVDA
jgi:hypothetical protein